jgi:hypothetical protein
MSTNGFEYVELASVRCQTGRVMAPKGAGRSAPGFSAAYVAAGRALPAGEAVTGDVGDAADYPAIGTALMLAGLAPRSDEHHDKQHKGERQKPGHWGE